MVMTGEARWKWQHEIVRSRKGRIGDAWKRVSLTFRVERKEAKRDDECSNRDGMTVKANWHC